MKASYNWLREYCEFDLPAHELAERLSHSGLNVESYEPRGDDWILDVEVKANRPDCLGHVGIAREVAAITGSELQLPPAELQEQADRAATDSVSVQVAAPGLCPRYTARVVEGIAVGPSPNWVRQRLETCGIRPVNNVVDATNYVLLECAQPLHAFDLARIRERRIVVRRAEPGEVITTIDGTEHELTGEECVIADAARPVALAGVMGGLDSEIGEATSDVLVEAARFDARSVRRTSRAHAVASESSYRFERGVDPEVTDWASRRVCRLITELAGGRVLSGVVDVRADTTIERKLRLRFARVAHLLGIAVPPGETVAILEGLGLKVLGRDDGSVTVRVPSWRSDLTREVDLVEEVARIHGYDKISETTAMPVRPVMPSRARLARRRARRLIAGQGFDEAMTYSLTAPTPLQWAQPWHAGEPVGVRNPVTVARTHLRLTNMANLLHVRSYNAARGAAGVELFELGNVYLPRPDDETPEEKLCLTLLTDGAGGLRKLKGVLGNLLDALAIEDTVGETPGAAGPFAPGRSVELRLGGELLGCAGVTDPEVARQLDLAEPPALMELDFGLLADRCRLDPPYSPVPSYPATTRDLAVVVKEDVLWADIERCIRSDAPDVLESVEMFDVYRGHPVPAGQKSVAFSLTFRRWDRTITAEEAEAARATILERLETGLGAELR
jgi:phenylalanyl-tRNA synthetase beta chain